MFLRIRRLSSSIFSTACIDQTSEKETPTLTLYALCKQKIEENKTCFGDSTRSLDKLEYLYLISSIMNCFPVIATYGWRAHLLRFKLGMTSCNTLCIFISSVNYCFLKLIRFKINKYVRLHIESTNDKTLSPLDNGFVPVPLQCCIHTHLRSQSIWSFLVLEHLFGHLWWL